ncbi:MAG: PQQ-dependent sugar dehydrogenase [Chloroflexi bacterium]|nr:PQQ-dependent sugar dehydrogenase [Chloroflexota bacterium]
MSCSDMLRLRALILASPFLLLALALSACGGGPGVDEAPSASPTSASTFTPGTSAPPDAVTPSAPVPAIDPAANISLPPGFAAYPIATGFFRPTSIALAADGTLYISERHGSVERIIDADGDGFFESSVTFAETSGEITGLLPAPDGGLYISATGVLLLVRDTDGDGSADSSVEIVPDLPHGLHQNNGLVLGPDGRLYLTNGSTCDDCNDPDERSGTILRVNPDGSDLRTFAAGLRNPYDLTFDAQGRLWATDNGSDTPCETIDELNLITDGGNYGWPYGEDGCDPLLDGLLPAADLGLHTASTGIVSYDAQQFPPVYRGNLFITLWGSFFTEPELPPQLLRVPIDETGSGPQAAVETFAEGFAHPIDIAVDRDGTLLVLDYGEGGVNDKGTLYRIVYVD